MNDHNNQPPASEMLRGYQRVGSDFLVSKLRACNYDQQGCGKTPTTLDAVRRLMPQRALVHCPKRALKVWEREAAIWAPNHRVVRYTGKPSERDAAWETLRSSDPVIVLTNWAHAEELRLRVGKGSWDLVIGDEIHGAGILNRKSNTFKTMEQVHTEGMFWLTGSPTPHGCVDLWPVAHLIEPKEFKSFWKFVNEYAIINRDMFGTSINRNPKDREKFRKEIIDRFTIRRLKKDVIDDLPIKQDPQFIPLDMTPTQKRFYVELVTDMLAEADNGDLIITPNAIGRDLRLRQLLVSPRLLGIEDDGAALEAVLSMVCEETEPFLVFTPFREAAELVASRLHRIVGPENVEVVMGGLDEDELDRRVQRFQSGNASPRALVGTIRSAESWTATAATNVYFLGFEWARDANEQAEDRAHRFGQKNLCNFYYPYYEGTIEDKIKMYLEDKSEAMRYIFTKDDFMPKEFFR